MHTPSKPQVPLGRIVTESYAGPEVLLLLVAIVIGIVRIALFQ